MGGTRPRSDSTIAAAAAAAATTTTSTTTSGAEGAGASSAPAYAANAARKALVVEAELSVRNDTDLPVTLQQAGVDFEAAGFRNGSKFEICVPPRSWHPFGWADPSAGSVVIASVGTSLGGDAIIEMIDMLRVGETTSLDLSHLGFPREELVIRVAALGSGKVLHVTRQHRLTKEQLQVQQGEALLRQPHNYVLKVSATMLSISLIAERPVRREFVSLCLLGVEGRVLYAGTSAFFRSSTSYELKVMDLVMDNYCETAVFPVLLNSRDTGDKRKILETRRKRAEARELQELKRSRQRDRDRDRDHDDSGSVMSAESGTSKNSKGSFSRASGSGGGGGFASADGDTWRDTQSQAEFDEMDPINSGGEGESSLDLNFLIIMVAQEVPLYASTVIFRQAALRMLELEVMVDSSTLQLYAVDLHNDLMGISPAPVPVPVAGAAKAEAGAGPLGSSGLELNRQLLAAAQRFKVYFESFVMHPLKLRLSFVPTPFPACRPKEEDVFSHKAYRTLRLAKEVVQVNELVVKMSSFIFQNAMESVGSLGARVAAKITEDLKQHLVQIAGRLLGGLSVIGKPANLTKNIGSGVQDFFYEPYQGLMHSPKGFAIGAARGTRRLFAGFASGLVASTASIVGSTSKGLAKGGSLLSGDKEFRAKRDDKRRMMNAGGGGVKQGMQAGAESVLEGFKSGFQGLVRRPFEEGQKSGALGFVKGVGLGLAGALTKPVVGITDGIGMAATGVSNRLNNVQAASRLRPPRAFRRSEADYSALVLCPWDAHAAAAQEFVTQRAKKEGYEDGFAAYVALGGDPEVHRSLASRRCVCVRACVLFFASFLSPHVSPLLTSLPSSLLSPPISQFRSPLAPQLRQRDHQRRARVPHGRRRQRGALGLPLWQHLAHRLQRRRRQRQRQWQQRPGPDGRGAGRVLQAARKGQGSGWGARWVVGRWLRRKGKQQLQRQRQWRRQHRIPQVRHSGNRHGALQAPGPVCLSHGQPLVRRARRPGHCTQGEAATAQPGPGSHETRPGLEAQAEGAARARRQHCHAWGAGRAGAGHGRRRGCAGLALPIRHGQPHPSAQGRLVRDRGDSARGVSSAARDDWL